MAVPPDTAEYEAVKEFTRKIVYEHEEDTTEMYNKWAATYDRDVAVLERKGPYYGAEYLSKALGDMKNARIIDVAAGSGLVAHHLKEFGFTNIDALDGSKEMLDLAREKDLYKNYFCLLLSDEPTNIPTGSYDAAVCSGGFAKGHLPTNCIKEIIRLVKPGGVIVLCYREDLPKTVEEYKDLPDIMEQLERQGLWKLTDKQKLLDYYKESEITGVILTYKVT